MKLKDNDIEIGFDDIMGVWYLEAFNVKQYLSVDPHGVWTFHCIKKKNFLDAGYRAKKILVDKLVFKGILGNDKK